MKLVRCENYVLFIHLIRKTIFKHGAETEMNKTKCKSK